MRGNETTMSVPQVPQTAEQTGGSHASLIARLQRRLNDLASQQEKLTESREQLLVDREAMSMVRRKIQEERTRTAGAEIVFLNVLRKHFKELGRPLPDDLLLAYEEVEKYHSRLRLLEDENLQAEEDLGISEWEFIEMETDLYQYHLEQLLSEELETETEEVIPAENISKRTPVDLFPPTPPVQYEALLAEHGRLMKCFDNLRKQQMLRMDTFTDPEYRWMQVAEDTQMDNEATKLSSELLDLIAQCEMKLSKLRPDLDLGASAKFEKKRQSSEPDMNRNSVYERIETTSRANSEGTLSPNDDYIDVNKNISEWSLCSLKSSALEKLQYLNFLRPKIVRTDATERGFEDWEPAITRSWANENANALTSPERGVSDDKSLLHGGQIVTTAIDREQDQRNEIPGSHSDSLISSHDTPLVCRDATDSSCSIENGVDAETTLDEGFQDPPQQIDRSNSGLRETTSTIVQVLTVPEYRARPIENSKILTLDDMLTLNYTSIDRAANPSSSSATLASKVEEVGCPLLLVPALISMHGDAIQCEPWLRLPASMSQKCTAEEGNDLLHASVTWIFSSRMTAITLSCQEIERKTLIEFRSNAQKVSQSSDYKTSVVLKVGRKIFPYFRINCDNVVKK
jgi:hypothetical protein